MLNFFEINAQSKGLLICRAMVMPKVPVAVKKKWHELMRKLFDQAQIICVQLFW